MSSPYISNAVAYAEAQALNVDTTLFGGAYLRMYSGTKPANANTALSGNVLLATFILPAASANSVSSSGVITFGTIASATAVSGGTASFFRITSSSGTSLCDGDIGTVGTDMILNTVSIAAADVITLTAFTFTVTQ